MKSVESVSMQHGQSLEFIYSVSVFGKRITAAVTSESGSVISAFMTFCLQAQPKESWQHPDQVREEGGTSHSWWYPNMFHMNMCKCLLCVCVCSSVWRLPAPPLLALPPGPCSQLHRALSPCPRPPVTLHPSGQSECVCAIVYDEKKKKKKKLCLFSTVFDSCWWRSSDRSECEASNHNTKTFIRCHGGSEGICLSLIHSCTDARFCYTKMRRKPVQPSSWDLAVKSQEL